jgi:hypothetical protein
LAETFEVVAAKAQDIFFDQSGILSASADFRVHLQRELQQAHEDESRHIEKSN